MTEEGKLQVRMVTGQVVRVQLEAGRDGVNTTKVAVVGRVSSGKIGGVEEDEVGRGQKERRKRGAAAFSFQVVSRGVAAGNGEMVVLQ